MTKLRIVLAEDHKMIREALRMLVNAQADMEVIGEADDGLAAIALVETQQPDVVVMDVSMPQLNGLKATETLKQLHPDVKILVLTRHTDRGYVEQLLRSGAKGYVLKQSASEELVRAVRRVAAGQIYVDPGVTEQLVNSVVGSRRARDSHARRNLTKREEDVLRLVAWGLLTKEIAARLDISMKTVETHKANAMRKLGMSSRIDVVRYALFQGWLQES